MESESEVEKVSEGVKEDEGRYRCLVSWGLPRISEW